jgi:hypothetical protein
MPLWVTLHTSGDPATGNPGPPHMRCIQPFGGTVWLSVTKYRQVVALRSEDDKESPADYAGGRSLNVTTGGT